MFSIIEDTESLTKILPFDEVVAEIEAILSNPDATKADLERAKDLAEAVNQHDKNNPDCDKGIGSRGGTASAADESQTGTKADTKADEDTKADDTKDESKPKAEPKKKSKKGKK